MVVKLIVIDNLSHTSASYIEMKIQDVLAKYPDAESVSITVDTVNNVQYIYLLIETSKTYPLTRRFAKNSGEN